MQQMPTLALGGWTPWVKRLIITNTLFYIVFLIVTRWVKNAFMMDHLTLIPSALFSGEVWQVFTYQFLHADNIMQGNFGPLQLLLDMFALWMFGSIFERRWGGRRFMIFYLISGIGAGLILSLVALTGVTLQGTPLAQLPHVSANGAIYAIMVAYGLTFPNQQVYFYAIFPLKGKHLLLVILIATFLYALATSPLLFIIHAAGMMMGLVMVTGTWRIWRYPAAIRIWLLRRRKRKLARRLHVVPDDDRDNGGYLH